jgi:hypothetical protein
MPPRVALLSLLVLGLVTSAAAVACSGAAGPPRHPEPRRVTVLTREEIERSGAMNAYEAVAELRPLWLNSRGQNTLQHDRDIVVYLDRAPIGDRRALYDVQALMITSMQYLNPAQADFRFGRGHTHGAIVVYTGLPLDPPPGADTTGAGATDSTAPPE